MKPLPINSTMRKRSRSGAALVEAAIVLPLALTSVFALLDLGMATARSNSLSDGARHVARMAIVRGERSDQAIGPDTWTGTAADDHPLAVAVRPRLMAMPEDQVQLTISWPDGGQAAGDRVHVALRFNHASLLLDLFGEFDLSAESTMRIVY